MPCEQQIAALRACARKHPFEAKVTPVAGKAPGGGPGGLVLGNPGMEKW